MENDDYAALRTPAAIHNSNARCVLQGMYGQASADLVPVFVRKIGSREEVWDGVAERTKGGLRKDDLQRKVVKVDPKGREYTKLVSRRASEAAQRSTNLGDHLKGGEVPKKK